MIDIEATSLRVIVSSDELKQIEIFKSRAEKLLCNSLVLNGFKSSADLRANGAVPSWSFELPPEEAFESLLMRFRHFWLEKESCHFFKVLNIVERHVPDVRNYTKELRVLWTQGLFHSAHVYIGDQELTSEKLINVWFNAEFFHNDGVKKSELYELIDRIDSCNSIGFARWLLVGSICERCNAVFQLNKLLARVDTVIQVKPNE